VGSHHDSQISQNQWHSRLNLFLTKVSLLGKFGNTFTVLVQVGQDQDFWTALFNRVPARPCCTKKTSLSHFAGNGEL